MAADSDGQTLQAVVICEGDLRDPEFPGKFRHLVGRLNKLLLEKPKSRKLKVKKVRLSFDNRRRCESATAFGLIEIN